MAKIVVEQPLDWARFSKPLSHPGEVLAEEYMAPLGLSAAALARLLGLSGGRRIQRLARCEQAMTADIALRLGIVLGTSAKFWMDLQASRDLSAAAIAARSSLRKIKRYKPAD